MSRKRNFSDRMNDAVTAVINQEFSQNKAAKEYEVSREALQRHVKATKEGVSIAKVGRKCEMSKEEETLIAKTVQTVVDRGFGFTKPLLQDFVKRYIENVGRETLRFNSQRPGLDWIDGFMKRQNLVLRKSSNIKRGRASINEDNLTSFFNELEESGIKNIPPTNIFNYDETALSDDPAAPRILCRRGTRRVEMVREHSKTNTSIMFCGSASGHLLPLYVVYKAANLYEGWTTVAPQGSLFNVTKVVDLTNQRLKIGFGNCLFRLLHIYQEQRLQLVTI